MADLRERDMLKMYFEEGHSYGLILCFLAIHEVFPSG